MQLNNVMVVVDPDQERHPALEKAKDLARDADFDVLLVSCDYPGHPTAAVDVTSRIRNDFLQERKFALEKIAEPLREQGLTVVTAAIWDRPGYKVLAEKAEQSGADLLILTPRRHSADHSTLSADDWQLVRCITCPLLLARTRIWKPTPIILAAVDPLGAHGKPKRLDHDILASARFLTGLMGGDLLAMHAYDPIPVSAKFQEGVKHDHAEAFKALLSDQDVPETQQLLIKASPWDAIDSLADELQPDLVVMGAISRSFIHEVFIGSTAQKVLDELECDVVIIKPEGFESPLAAEPDAA